MSKTLLFLLFPIFLFGQTFEGHIKDASTNANIAFANIGILNKSIGTVSNEKGYFKFNINNKVKESDTLMISMIGYTSKMYSISAFRAQIQSKTPIILTPTSYDLSEVVVIPKDYKTRIVGNKKRNENISVSFNNNYMGHEMGLLIKIKERPAYIQKVFINITSCSYDSIFYRLNVYEFDKKTKKPTKNLLPKPIYVSYSKTDIKNTIEIDLRHLSVLVQDDFVVSLELVKDLGEGKINFSGSFMKSRGYFREISQAGWQRAPFRFGPGIYAEIKQEK